MNSTARGALVGSLSFNPGRTRGLVHVGCRDPSDGRGSLSFAPVSRPLRVSLLPVAQQGSERVSCKAINTSVCFPASPQASLGASHWLIQRRSERTGSVASPSVRDCG